jgi:uncharacterized membrane protein
MQNSPHIVLAGSYGDLDLAKEDYKTVKQMQADGYLAHVSGAFVTKNDKGKLSVHEHTFSGEVAGATGAVIGGVLGAAFPPLGLGIIAGLALGAGAVGGVSAISGHFLGGISRKDMQALGDTLHEGEAGLIVFALPPYGNSAPVHLGNVFKHANRFEVFYLDEEELKTAYERIAKDFA